MASSPILITILRSRGTIINNIRCHAEHENEACCDRVYPEPVEGAQDEDSSEAFLRRVDPERSRRAQDSFLLNHSI